MRRRNYRRIERSKKDSTIGFIDEAGLVREGDRNGSQLDELLGHSHGEGIGAGDETSLALERLPLVGEHSFGEVDDSKALCLHVH